MHRSHNNSLGEFLFNFLTVSHESPHFHSANSIRVKVAKSTQEIKNGVLCNVLGGSIIYKSRIDVIEKYEPEDLVEELRERFIDSYSEMVQKYSKKKFLRYI